MMCIEWVGGGWDIGKECDLLMSFPGGTPLIGRHSEIPYQNEPYDF